MARPLPEVGKPVVAQPLLGDTLELEQEHVPRLLPLGEAGVAKRCGVADRYGDEAGDPVGHESGERPCEGGTPVVTDNVGPLDGEVVENAGDISGEVEHAVGVGHVGLVAVPEAAQVGSDRAVAGLDQCPDLVTPQGVRIGPAVHSSTAGPLVSPAAATSRETSLEMMRISLDRYAASPSTALPGRAPGRDTVAALQAAMIRSNKTGAANSSSAADCNAMSGAYVRYTSMSTVLATVHALVICQTGSSVS